MELAATKLSFSVIEMWYFIKCIFILQTYISNCSFCSVYTYFLNGKEKKNTTWSIWSKAMADWKLEFIKKYTCFSWLRQGFNHISENSFCMCSYVTDRITEKKRLHFFVEFSHVSSQKCTCFAIERMFLLGEKDRLCYVWLCCANGGFCYTMHKAKKSFSLDEIQLKFQITKTEKIKFHIRENVSVCLLLRLLQAPRGLLAWNVRHWKG